MVYSGCPFYEGGMMGYGYAGFFLNWILGAIIFSLIFWGAYVLFVKNNRVVKRGRRK